MGLRQISLILDKRKNEEFLINKKTYDYEERNVEICVADTRGDTYRDSNKPRSAELYVGPPLPSPARPLDACYQRDARREGDELEKSMNIFHQELED